MPSHVFKCEGCDGHRPFLIYEMELIELQRKNPIQKYCQTCRAMTNWVAAFPEHRVRQSNQNEG